MSKRRQYKVTPEELVVAWQTSKSVAEVAKKLNMPKANIQTRVASYRRLGVKLKRMPRGSPRKLNIDALNRLANP